MWKFELPGRKAAKPQPNTPSPPCHGGEGRGEEARLRHEAGMPLSSILSPLRRGERKENMRNGKSSRLVTILSDSTAKPANLKGKREGSPGSGNLGARNFNWVAGEVPVPFQNQGSEYEPTFSGSPDNERSHWFPRFSPVSVHWKKRNGH